MSTPPPPPPPFGYTSAQGRFDRQAMKAQRRAAQQQARFQRAQWRTQMRAARRTSLVGPILLVGFGVVLLFLESGHLLWSQVLWWLGRWWPLVLIVAGLIMVAEWALDRTRVPAPGPYMAPRRVLGGGAATLLILLAIVGLGVIAADRGSAWAHENFDTEVLHHGFWNWRDAFGAHTETTHELQAPLSATGTLTIEDAHGDIKVTGSSQDGQVHVSVTQRMYAWQQNEIEAHKRAEQVRLDGDRNALLLTAPLEGEDEADLTVELPHDAVLTVRNSNGDLTIAELRGAVELTSKAGDVQLTALSGPVHLHTQDDDATITAHGLANGLTLDGRSGDIHLSEIQGPVALHGDFFGTTHLEHIRGEVRFQSSFTNLACAGIPGELNIEGRSDLTAQRLDGPVTVTTTNRNLTLDGIRGSATINDRNGSVALTLADAIQPVQITNENGSVEVGVPAQHGFTLRARTQNGQIENEFGLTPETMGETSHVQAQVQGGGPMLTLQTTEGDITLRRAKPADATDWDEAPNRITPVPPNAPRAPKAPHTKRQPAKAEPAPAAGDAL